MNVNGFFPHFKVANSERVSEGTVALCEALHYLHVVF